MIDEKAWVALSSTAPSPSGWAKMRVYHQSGHDLWLGVKQPQLFRALLYVIPVQKAPHPKQLPQLRHMNVLIAPYDEEHVEVQITLEDPHLSDVFSVLARDIAGCISQAASTEAGVRALIDRLAHWRDLLQPHSDRGLSREKRRGLYGELYLLRRLLDIGVPTAVVVESWVGPTGAHQDLQAPTAAVEVKTTASKQPQLIRVSSERQLDTTGVNELFLAHLSLDERNSGPGENLPSIVTDLEQRLAGQYSLDFRAMLYIAGLLPTALPEYEEPVYWVRSLDYFHLVDGFPRIVEAMCPEGVGDVQYSIQLASMREFAVLEVDLGALLGAPK